jgi:uncharacterized membrane protein YbaN (DUF454 family)
MQHTAIPPIVRPWMRPVYFVLGAVFLVVGVVGVVLPLIPTTGPVLLAAFFFARSSVRFHDWLMEHPRFGPLIADFRSGKGIPLTTKVWALTAMTAAFGIAGIYVTTGWIARSILVTVGVLAIGYVARLPISRR